MFCSLGRLWSAAYPYLPIAAYLLLCIATPARQSQVIPDRRHTVLDARVGANLALVGFSFTVVSLIVTLFQSQLRQVYEATFLFSLSLACFFASYLLLYLRLRRFFDTFSEGLTNAGLWATIAGLRELFLAFDTLQPIAVMFTLLLIGLSIYIAIDVGLKWQDRNLVEGNR